MKYRPDYRRILGGRATGGVTLIELILALGILAALLAIAIPYYQSHAIRARDTSALAEVACPTNGAEPTPACASTSPPAPPTRQRLLP